MTRATYYIAKFVPDVLLGEPRNVGVILWTPESVEARFLGETTDAEPRVDGRSLRGFESSASFKQWVSYLRGQIQKGLVTDPHSGEKISRQSSAFMAAIASSLNETLSLTVGGYFVDELAQSDLRPAVDRLFSKFVHRSETARVGRLAVPHPRRQPMAGAAFRDIIGRTGINNSPYFHEKKRLPCTLKGQVEEELEFSYAFENGALHRLFQVVELPTAPEAIGKNVHDAAWKFERAIESGHINSQGVVAILLADQARLDDQKVSRGIDILSSIGQVLNLADTNRAVQQIAALPSLSTH